LASETAREKGQELKDKVKESEIVEKASEVGEKALEKTKDKTSELSNVAKEA